ncbi:CPBP family intramembrane metalloprotease [Metabacillus sp. GX 13764]|uniref:CPBP family intramembrane glutamic endopeptidase n=1 Tax=Metabacillus kandeliae TaxID=2900151 RepID=UPI001E42B346|nr:type II CAAX endopeptidase family protein [Metabacillus kandeliae]MCD7034112.1 CPBP family intramembrane metalloprotease [Metabacillus kandeliae]
MALLLWKQENRPHASGKEFSMLSNQLTQSEKTESESKKPGWPEIGIMGLAYFIIVIGIAQIINSYTEDSSVLSGISFAALSGIAGLGAFLAAYVLRIRSASAFGIRRTSARWLLAGIGFGIGVLLFSLIVGLIMSNIGYSGNNTQAAYQSAAGGGTLAFIVQFLMIAVLTPLGEEFAFRAVLANALKKYGPWICIVGSAFIFAMVHGLNEIWPAAFATGLATGYLFYRTGSVWPGVIVHATYNGSITILTAIAAGFQ